LTLVHYTALHEFHFGYGARMIGQASFNTGALDYSTINIYDSDQVVPSVVAMSGWSDRDLDFECLIV